jgi:predicted nuclease of predicted toxin-antitoxin system
MTFFLDENFPKKSIQTLEEAGHKVIDIRGTEQEGITDIEIFSLAKKSKAVFLTCDRDFYHTIHLTEKPHFGIIVIALRQPNSSAILEKLEWILNKVNELDLPDTCILLRDQKYSIYK